MLKTEKVKIRKKFINLNINKISYTTFKGKLYLINGGVREFKNNFKDFWKIEDKYNICFKGYEPTEVYRDYQDFKNLITTERKESSPRSRESYKKQVERIRERFRERIKERNSKKQEILKNLNYANSLINNLGFELVFKDNTLRARFLI